MLTTACWTSLSSIAGTASGRCRPFAFLARRTEMAMLRQFAALSSQPLRHGNLLSPHNTASEHVWRAYIWRGVTEQWSLEAIVDSITHEYHVDLFK
jgi:hypothetical protein